MLGSKLGLPTTCVASILCSSKAACRPPWCCSIAAPDFWRRWERAAICTPAAWPDPVFCQPCSRLMLHLCGIRPDSHCRTSLLGTANEGMDKPRRQTMGRGPISEPVGRLIKIRPAQTTPLVSATGQRYSVGQPGPCKDGAMSSSRPFMAERGVVWTACTRSEHPLSDPVVSKRVEIPMSIGSAASVLLQSLVTPRGLVNPARPAASCDGKPHRSNVVGRHGRWA